MRIPVSSPCLGKRELSFVARALRRGEISGFSGSFIGEFEKVFADFCDVRHAVAVSSGTTALHLALATLGIKSGDEVLVQSFTNMATFFAVLYQGAKPIPIDSEPRTLNIDYRLIEKKITSKTKAIIVVHIYGHPVDMDPIMEIARRRKLFVIEDAAEAHGALYKNRKTGSLADIGCFSFYANKIVTTGEGGMITTNNSQWASKACSLKSLAFGDKEKFMHKDIGFNYRLTNFGAAIGLAQMAGVQKVIDRKRKIAEFYKKKLSIVPEITLPVEESYAYNVYWMFNIILRDRLAGKRNRLMADLKKAGIDTREDFIPFNLQEIFLKQGLVEPESCPIANNASKNGLYLPSGPNLSKQELNYVSDNIIRLTKNYL